jgi:hypothetical protein
VEGAQLEQAQLMATDGRIVRRIQDGQPELNVSNLPEGLYLLQVWTTKGLTSERLIITH